MSEPALGEASPRKVRLAIVGTGGVANAHVRAHRRNPDLVEIVALSDVVPGKAAEFAARHGLDGVHCLGHYDEALALSEVEAVDVCTRPDGHAPASIAALAAGQARPLREADGGLSRRGSADARRRQGLRAA